MERTVYVKSVSGSPLTTTPSEKTLLPFNASLSTSGETSVISAPGANVKIVIVSAVLQNVSSTATTIKLLNGSSGTTLFEVLGQNQGDGLTVGPYPSDARPKLSANTALVANLSGSNACKVSGWYYTE